MIVKCIANRREFLNDAERKEFGSFVASDHELLEIGKEYVVYGVSFTFSLPLYVICRQDDDDYVILIPSPFFDIVDPRIPPDWCLTLNGVNAGPVAILPQLWAHEPAFMERLLDGEDSQAIAEFEELKKSLAAWHRDGNAV